MAHDLCEDLELVADDGGFDDYYWDDDFHFHDDDGFSASPTTPASVGAPRQQQQQQQMGDISASDYKEGEDMQGIPWERLNYTRDQYRRMRLKEYKSYQNLTRSHSGLQQQERKQVERKDTFYDFHLNTRAVKSTIVHFQLRNLLWPTSKHDVYLVQSYSVTHWSALLRRGREVLNVAGRLAPTQNVKGAGPLSRVQISAMAVKDNLMVAGGFQGELICKTRGGILHQPDRWQQFHHERRRHPPGTQRRHASDGGEQRLRRQDVRRREIQPSHAAHLPVVRQQHVGEPRRQAAGGPGRQHGVRGRRPAVGQGGGDAARAPGLLLRVGVAPRRPRPGDGEPGRDVPAVGRAQPVGAVRRARGPDRRRPGPPLLPRRQVPGRGRGRRLRARVRRRGRVRRRRAGGGRVRGGRRRRVQPRRRGAVRERRRPHLRRPARVPTPAGGPLPRRVFLLRERRARAPSVVYCACACRRAARIHVVCCVV
uniref:Transducin/WD40 repeat-like superfamily protein n=1 Tax=Zea mays TaxID=4577 RepID=A0A804LL54_MAIZE